MVHDVLEMIEAVSSTAQNVIVEAGGLLDYQLLEREILKRLPGLNRSDLLAILQFLRRLAPAVFAAKEEFKVIDLSKVDVMAELSEQYSVAKDLLKKAREGTDVKEQITFLKETTRILSTTVQLRDRLQARQELEEFEAAVLEVLDGADQLLRKRVLDRLEGLDGSGNETFLESAMPTDEATH